MAAVEDPAIVCDLIPVEPALLRFYSSPLDTEPVSITAGLSKQTDILVVSIVMITGKTAGLGKIGMLGSAKSECLIFSMIQ